MMVVDLLLVQEWWMFVRTKVVVEREKECEKMNPSDQGQTTETKLCFKVDLLEFKFTLSDEDRTSESRWIRIFLIARNLVEGEGRRERER